MQGGGRIVVLDRCLVFVLKLKGEPRMIASSAQVKIVGSTGRGHDVEPVAASGAESVVFHATGSFLGGVSSMSYAGAFHQHARAGGEGDGRSSGAWRSVAPGENR